MPNVLRFQRRHKAWRAEATFREGDGRVVETERFATPVDVWDWMRGRWADLVRLNVYPLHGQALEEVHRVAAEREAELLGDDGGAA